MRSRNLTIGDIQITENSSGILGQPSGFTFVIKLMSTSQPLGSYPDPMVGIDEILKRNSSALRPQDIQNLRKLKELIEKHNNGTKAVELDLVENDL